MQAALRTAPKANGAKTMAEEVRIGLTRRSVIGTSIVAGAAGAAASLGIARFSSMTEAEAQPAPRAASPHSSSEVAPGELDEYYVFSSSGQSGEIRILGLPSMRE